MSLDQPPADLPDGQADSPSHMDASETDAPEMGAAENLAEATPAEEAPVAPKSNLTRNIIIGLFLFASVVIASGFMFKTDYVALEPGSARDTEPLVSIEGTEEFPSDGELFFTTVRLNQFPSLWEYLWISMDDDSLLLPAENVLGDRSVEENREVNLQLMTDSKDIARAVALEALGYDVIASNGILIVEIVADSAAEGEFEPGDIVRQADGQVLSSANDLVNYLATLAPGDEVTFVVQPVGEVETEERTVALGARDDDPERAFLGVGPTDQIEFLDFDPGFDVEIDSGSVGGPSAGLAFTLAILDQLTPGELTGGAQVAVTGTIGIDGSVGAVGGVPQKTAAVRDLGIEYFIVPTALGEEQIAVLEERAGDSLEIIPVATLDEALEVLDRLGGDVGVVDDFEAATG